MSRIRSLFIYLLAGVMILSCTSCLPKPSSVSASSSYEAYTQESQSAAQSASQPATSPADSAAMTAEQQAFSEFTNEIFKNEISGNLLDMHYTLKDPAAYGIEDYEISLGQVTTSGMTEAYQVLQEYYDQLTTFNYDLLTEEQQITYDVFKDYIEVSMEGQPYTYYQTILSPSVGTQAQLPILLAEYTFYSETDVLEYLTLLAQVQDYFNSILAYEGEKAEQGLFMSDRAVDDIITSCESFMQNPETNFLIETFDDRLDSLEGISDETKAAYKEQNRALVTDSIIPAYQSLIDGLNTLKGSGTNNEGLAGFEGGQDYYRYLVKTNTGSSRSVEELTDLIETRLNMQLVEMFTILQTSAQVSNDLESFHFTLTEPEEILNDLKVKIKEDFPDLTETNFTIKYVHESLESVLSPAFYLTPPLDDLLDNVIYINNSSAGQSSTLYATLAHEGYPGHLFQTVYASSLGQDPIRRILYYAGYSEGWATYVEHYSYGLDDNNSEEVSRAASLNSSASLALYSLLDIYINFDGWNIEQTAEFLSTYYGELETEVVESVYYAMVEEPGNYLKYYVGYLEIIMMREKAEEALGDDFNLKEFHTFILDMGECSFDVLNQYLDKWLAAQ